MSYIDDIMGFNPSDLDAFQEQTGNSNFDANIYKTNPVKLSKAEDGHYRAKVRVIYNPFNFKQSIVAQRTYFIQDAEGSLLVRSKGASPDKNAEYCRTVQGAFRIRDSALQPCSIERSRRQ